MQTTQNSRKGQQDVNTLSNPEKIKVSLSKSYSIFERGQRITLVQVDFKDSFNVQIRGQGVLKLNLRRVSNYVLKQEFSPIFFQCAKQPIYKISMEKDVANDQVLQQEKIYYNQDRIIPSKVINIWENKIDLVFKLKIKSKSIVKKIEKIEAYIKIFYIHLI